MPSILSLPDDLVARRSERAAPTRSSRQHGLPAPLAVLRRGGGRRRLVAVNLARRRRAHLPHAGLRRDLSIASQVICFSSKSELIANLKI